MAQTLSFTHNPVSGLYEAEFQIEKAAVLHVERAVAGRLKLGVRTTGAGKYALVDEFEGQDYKSTIDAELMGEIYPKWVKVSSESEPTYGEVVSEGEVTEIKSQSKEVEVTSNGTMDITPDAGFSYLNSVKVKTNVQSGEGGGSAMEYYDISGLTGSMSTIVMFSSVAKFLLDGKPATGPSYYTDHAQSASNFGGYLAAGFDMSIRITQGDQSMTLKDIVGTELDSLPRITESEFYNLA